jgi:hypothetical protein
MTEEEIGGYKLGNPGDEVVFELQDIVNASQVITGKSLDKLEKRAEWWEENGEEEYVILGTCKGMNIADV